MSGQRTLFDVSLLRLWDELVIQVPEASGVHAIVPEGADPLDVARAAIALVLGVDPDGIALRLIDVADEPTPIGQQRDLAQVNTPQV